METFADSTLYLAIRKGAASVLPKRYASYADDLAQDGWIKADRWRRSRQVEIEYPATLGYRIGRNLSLTFLKREKSRAGVETEPPFSPPSSDIPDLMESMFSDSGKNAEDLQDLISVREALSGAYEQLSPRQTEIWPLLFQGHTQRHICEVLDLWPSQVSKDVDAIERAIKALLGSYSDPTDPSDRPPTGVLLRRSGGSNSTATGSHGGAMNRKTRTGKSSLIDTPIPQSLVDRMLRLVLRLPGFSVPGCPAEQGEMKDLAAILIELGVAPWLKPAPQLTAKKTDIERAVHSGEPLLDDSVCNVFLSHCHEDSDQSRSLPITAMMVKAFLDLHLRACAALYWKEEEDDDGMFLSRLVKVLGSETPRVERADYSWWLAEPVEKSERRCPEKLTVFILGGTGSSAIFQVLHFLGHDIRGAGIDVGWLPQQAADGDADLGSCSAPGDLERKFDRWYDHSMSISGELPVTHPHIRVDSVKFVPQLAADCDANLGSCSGPGDWERKFDFWNAHSVSISCALPVTCYSIRRAGACVRWLLRRAGDGDVNLSSCSGSGNREWKFDLWYDRSASISGALSATCDDGFSNRNPVPCDGSIGLGHVTDREFPASGSGHTVQTNRKPETLLEIYGLRSVRHDGVSYSPPRHELGSWPYSTSSSCKLTFRGDAMTDGHCSSDWSKELKPLNPRTVVAFKEERGELNNLNSRVLLRLEAWVTADRKDFKNLLDYDLDGWVLNNVDAEFEIVFDEALIWEEEPLN